METVFDDLANFKGSPSEKAVMIFCKQNQIIYSKLTDEEKLWLLKIMDKSKLMKRLVTQREKTEFYIFGVLSGLIITEMILSMLSFEIQKS